MPTEVVSKTKNEATDHWKAGLIGAAGIGGGSLLLGTGLGMPVGATIAGSYAGGTAGTVITVAGMAFGIASLIFGNPFGPGVAEQAGAMMGGGGGGSGQGVK